MSVSDIKIIYDTQLYLEMNLTQTLISMDTSAHYYVTHFSRTLILTLICSVWTSRYSFYFQQPEPVISLTLPPTLLHLLQMMCGSQRSYQISRLSTCSVVHIALQRVKWIHCTDIAGDWQRDISDLGMYFGRFQNHEDHF